MLNEKLLEVIKHEGVVALVTWSNDESHVANTWNSYINATEDGRLLIPAAGMIKTQKNIKQNNKIKITLGSKEVMGYKVIRELAS